MQAWSVWDTHTSKALADMDGRNLRRVGWDVKVRKSVGIYTVLIRKMTQNPTKEDTPIIIEWVNKIKSAKGQVERRKVIAELIKLVKTRPDMIQIVGYVIKEAHIHDEVETMRLRKYFNPKNNPVDLYEDFHGVVPIRKKAGYYEPPPSELITIGELSQINYRPVRGQHQNTEFYHKSGDDGQKMHPNNLILATDKEGKNLYLVKKNKDDKYPIFTNRGIIR